MQQRCVGRGATGTLPAAPRLRSLRESSGRRLADPFELLGDARGRESEPGSRARAETYGAELAGMLVDPGARLAMQAGDLSSIHKRLGLSRDPASEPLNQSIRQQVGEAIERGIVVAGLNLKRRCCAGQRTSSCAAHGPPPRCPAGQASSRTRAPLALRCDQGAAMRTSWRRRSAAPW
jgi:hypothetical protein